MLAPPAATESEDLADASQSAGDRAIEVAPPPPTDATASRTEEEWISVVRVLVLLTLIPALWFGVISVGHPVSHWIVLLLGGYVILVALGPRWLTALRRVDLIIVLDLIVITLLVVISGTVQSPFLFLYYLTILEAAGRLNLRQAMAASLAMAGVVILLWTQAGRRATFETVGFQLGAFIASGFFLALLFSMLVQEYRSTRERQLAVLLNRRLREATAQLEEQLEELQFYNDLAARLSGELRVEGVLEILLQVFLETAGLLKGAAYLCGENGIPHFVAARGFAWEEGGQEPGHLSLPALPEEAIGGEVVVHPYEPADGDSDGILTCVPLMRAGRLLAWLCGLGDAPGASSDSVLRRLRGMAAQGVSALDAARLHEEVQRMVSVDPKMSLYAWNGLKALVADDIRRCSGSNLVFSLAEIQLEDYGSTWVDDNDRDLALRRAVHLLQAPLRHIDVLAHDGGGRFALLLPRLTKERAAELVQGLAEKLEEDTVAARLLGVNRLVVSAGVVTFPEDGASVAALFDGTGGLLAEGATTPVRVRVLVS